MNVKSTRCLLTAWAFVIFGAGVYIAQLSPLVRPHRMDSLTILADRLVEEQNEKARLEVDSTVSNRERDQRSAQLDSDIAGLSFELWIRNWHIPLLLLLVWGISCGIAVFLLIVRFFPVPSDRPALDSDATELPPAEEYIFESELHLKMESGFHRRQEALAFVNSDVMRKCPYCGGRLRPRSANERFKVQPINFFKKVPEGAIDRRLRMGSIWSVTNPAEVSCEGCQAIVRL